MDLQIVAKHVEVNPTRLSAVGPFVYFNMHAKNQWPLSELKLQRLKEIIRNHDVQLILKQLTETVFDIGAKHISLRVIDWFVTNYAKTRDVSYLLNNQVVHVYSAYLQYRRNFKRILLDPFRRNCKKEDVVYYVHDSKVYTSTCAQLNFFTFLAMYNILPFVRAHLSSIESDQSACLKHAATRRKTASANGQEFKRQKLSEDMTPTCSVIEIDRIL